MLAQDGQVGSKNKTKKETKRKNIHAHGRLCRRHCRCQQPNTWRNKPKMNSGRIYRLLEITRSHKKEKTMKVYWEETHTQKFVFCCSRKLLWSFFFASTRQRPEFVLFLIMLLLIDDDDDKYICILHVTISI